MKIYESITTLYLGKQILENFKDELNKLDFSYEDINKLQNEYEKVLYEMCNQAYSKGKNDLSEKEFLEWLDNECAYNPKLDENRK